MTEEPEKQPKSQRIFGDVSAAQVIATALASVTSVLLASSIGIAGSIIGVAVASVVSTLAASLYKRFISVSADKIKQLPVITEPNKTVADILPGHHDAAHASAPADEKHPSSPGQATEQSTALGRKRTPHGEEAQEDAHQKRVIHGLVAVCIVSAILAVAATGAVIYVSTAGEGIGTKPQPVSFVSSASKDRDASPQIDEGANVEGGNTTSSASSSSSASSASSSSSSADSSSAGNEVSSDSSSANSSASSSSSASSEASSSSDASHSTS